MLFIIVLYAKRSTWEFVKIIFLVSSGVKQIFFTGRCDYNLTGVQNYRSRCYWSVIATASRKSFSVWILSVRPIYIIRYSGFGQWESSEGFGAFLYHTYIFSLNLSPGNPLAIIESVVGPKYTLRTTAEYCKQVRKNEKQCF